MKLHYIGVCCLAVALLTGCGGKSEEEKAAEEAKVSVSDAVNSMQQMAEQAEEAEKNGPVETVDFRALKELLPADADGLPRKEATGEKAGAMGFKISTASGEYANADGTERIDLDIVDAGGTGALMGLAAWSMIDVDKETENGYERTGKIGDYKSYEKYDNANKDGEIAVLVKNRFVVTIKGNGVSAEKLKATLEDVDLDKLAGMK
ncbi:transposase [Rudanella paleaurantiibacter]|uniref:Transposase n=1 Tax=Rudanella paleaurantiibacter TaxID=2614655 RepID=A0A7J5TWB6_9BACT|nr:transposase [Rudanella paleaurantiibacter]KAB7728744.1 transposase [Rudanella paleaurantiibacter]